MIEVALIRCAVCAVGVNGAGYTRLESGARGGGVGVVDKAGACFVHRVDGGVELAGVIKAA